MSRENVEFVKALLDGPVALDKETLLATLPQLIPQVCDPEVEWIEDPTRADGRTYRGHEGVLASYKRWLEQWGEYRVEYTRLVDHGDDVFVEAVERGSGTASGASVSSAIYAVVTVRDQKLLRYREFYDRDTALQAAGRTE